MSTVIFAISRRNVLRLFDVNADGRIASKGKFEGEFIYAPYFYDLMLNGLSNLDCSNNVESRDAIDKFELDEKDFEEFPELAKNGYAIGDCIIFQQNPNGFYCELKKVRK